MSQPQRKANTAIADDTTILNHLLDTSSPSLCTLTPAHDAFRSAVRTFVQLHLTPAVVLECERSGGVPKELIRASQQAGLYGLRLPKHRSDKTEKRPAYLPESASIDRLYEYILIDELAACGSHGIVLELIGNFGMLLPLIDTFASEQMKEEILRPLLRADAFACFAFTEPPLEKKLEVANVNSANQVVSKRDASSSPQSKPSSRPANRLNLRTIAKQQGRDYFEVTGEKIFCSFAARSDYVLTACRAVPKEDDMSNEDSSSSSPNIILLMIPSNLPGVTIKNMPLTGWHSTSTTSITYNAVKVPFKYLLGEPTSSSTILPLLFSLLQSNITQERYVLSIVSLRSARVCLEDALKFARAHRIGMKRLSDSAVVRQQLIQMSVAIQQNRHLVESLTQRLLTEEKKFDANKSTSRPFLPSPSLTQQIALVKYACTRSLTEATSVSSSILGSHAVNPEGPGARIERLRRDACVSATTGGSEQTLIEFIMKRAKL